MKDILFLQYRSDASEKHEQECMFQHTGLSSDNIQFFNTVKNNLGDIITEIRKKRPILIIGGSGDFNISEIDANSEKGKIIDQTYKLIEIILKHNIPTLGICFGHQLLAHYSGVQVIKDPEQAENGITKITVVDEHIGDPIFDGVPHNFYASVSHKESLMSTPSNAVNLAYSGKCKNQVLKFSEKIYSSQFHPELDISANEFRDKLYPSYNGLTTSDESDTSNDTAFSHQFLRNFLKITLN